MIHLYTGNGKGKTSAAIGLAVRAAGRGQRICFSQFMKGSDSGELYAMRCLPQIEILRSEKDYGFYSSMSEQDKKELTEVHNRILRALLLAAQEGWTRSLTRSTGGCWTFRCLKSFSPLPTE